MTVTNLIIYLLGGFQPEYPSLASCRDYYPPPVLASGMDSDVFDYRNHQLEQHYSSPPGIFPTPIDSLSLNRMSAKVSGTLNQNYLSFDMNYWHDIMSNPFFIQDDTNYQ